MLGYHGPSEVRLLCRNPVSGHRLVLLASALESQGDFCCFINATCLPSLLLREKTLLLAQAAYGHPAGILWVDLLFGAKEVPEEAPRDLGAAMA